MAEAMSSDADTVFATNAEGHKAALHRCDCGGNLCRSADRSRRLWWSRWSLEAS
jgi:hypothetical protein